MTIVNNILKQMPGLSQPQRKFLTTLFVTILVLRGRVNFRNLSRYCDYAERTIARQFRAPFDWPDLPQHVLMTALDPRAELVSSHDASFIPKSGKQTFGLGHFFNGRASRAACGLEMSTPAVVDVTRRRASPITVWTATMRRRNILMKSSASICTPSPNCGATPTAYFSILVRTRSAVGHGVSMTGRSTSKS